MLTSYSLALVACLHGSPMCDAPMRQALIECGNSTDRNRCMVERAIAPEVTILRGRGPNQSGSEITGSGVTILRGGR